jgi:hypothetical protein
MKTVLAAVLLLLSSFAFAATEIGTWYDDLGSPEYGDSTLTIEKDNDKFFIARKNGDGSGSRYRLEKSGNIYAKVGDRFGAKYIITNGGLEIHDKAGYIRTAKKLK